ncbi:MAG: NAD-dependent epimerase/dehydratase family protein [Oscillochloris sp.]|nr:NAD-dependent epimerase/dehydratase family protein [Oscillochloris sp.]
MIKLLINGIDTALGAQIADRLGAQYPDLAVIGLGRAKPPGPIGRAEWLSAALNGQQILHLLRSEQITTVIHVGFLGIDGPDASREAAVQQNVLGSMELFGACAAAGVQRVVLRSHSWIYGALPTNPMGIEEHREITRSGLQGVVRDFAEVEQFVADFAPRHPYLPICSLRCGPLLGADTPLAMYLGQPDPQMIFGFDPILQTLHIDDAAAHLWLRPSAIVAGRLTSPPKIRSV